eukprot:724633-Hanusia_phi.AAC.1
MGDVLMSQAHGGIFSFLFGSPSHPNIRSGGVSAVEEKWRMRRRGRGVTGVADSAMKRRFHNCELRACEATLEREEDR